MEPWILHLKTTLSKELKDNVPCLLAVSGGVDSVVLCHLFKHFKLPFSIAHVNFKLRTESDQDEAFVRSLADQLQVECFVQHPMKGEVPSSGIQDWARDFRYAFFNRLIDEKGFQKVVLGHHLDDQVEQFFIKSLRPSGAFSLGGMNIVEANRFRPLISVPKEFLIRHALANGIEWREDKTNADPDKYDRNWWRKQGIPKIAEKYPDIQARIITTQSLIQESARAQARLLNYFFKGLWKEVYPGIDCLDLKQFTLRGGDENILNASFNSLGFSRDQVTDILKNAGTKEGKIFSAKWDLDAELRDNKLYVFSKNLKQRESVIINNIGQLEQCDFVREINLKKGDTQVAMSEKCFLLPINDSTFPLTIRPVTGKDKMQCFGLKGRSKALNDIFKEAQIPFCLRKRYFVWENDQGLLYLENLRSSELTRISGKSQEYYKIEIN